VYNNFGGDEMIKVLIVEDHPIFRRGLHTTLSQDEDIEIVGEAKDGYEALEKMEELSCDIILMDVQMAKREDGVETAKRIKERNPKIGIIILTAFSEYRELTDVADAYLIKDIEPTELIKTIKRVYRYATPKKPCPFTEIERKILPLLSKGLPDKLIKETMGIEESTVKGHLSNMRKKTGARNRVELIEISRKEGWI
jgi:DNA-binding NarL/FixJ family response regulator